MILIVILIFFLLLLCWLFFSPLEFQVDTRTPQASLRWISIGTAIIIYENDKWLLKIRVLFFSKQWDLEKLLFKEKKIKRIKKVKRKRKNIWFGKFLNLIKTFRVTKWQIAIDTGDCIKNAWLYPLNFYPSTRHHLLINFSDENYFLIVIRNAPWKLAYAFMK
ncbi:MAG: hypothetical protein ACHQF0_10480 [Chitinophagales bacterium]